MNNREFPQGITFTKHARSPEFVVGKIGIDREKFINYLQSKQGVWINFDVKLSKEGKMYIELDTWKPIKANEGEVKNPPIQKETIDEHFNRTGQFMSEEDYQKMNRDYPIVPDEEVPF